MKLAERKKTNKELNKLKKIFKGIPEDKYKVCMKLIENAAFMSEQLEELQAQIQEGGCVEEYKNGDNQYGKKKSAAVDVYNTMIKNYLSIIKQLNEYLPSDEKEEADALINYITRRQ